MFSATIANMSQGLGERLLGPGEYGHRQPKEHRGDDKKDEQRHPVWEPAPVEHVLVSEDQDRHRVQESPRSERLGNVRDGIEDRSEKLQHGEQMQNDVLQVAKMDIEGGEDQHEPE